jgi:predicted ATP-binding protein involved in virulence
MDDRITVIHGPNGFGKTAMLRILNAFFNSRYSELRTIPFSKFCVEFDNGSNVEIIKNYDDSDKVNSNIVFNFYYLNLDDIDDDLKSFSYSLPLKGISQEEPNWLEKLKKNIHIRLIQSQRLLKLPLVYSKSDKKRFPTLSTVSEYSYELATLMQDKFKEYGTISQSLDRSFPIRVVKQQLSSDITDEQLRNQLNELEETRSRLIEVGLLEQDEDSEFQIQLQDIDESTKNTLSVYVEDVEKKLNVFNEIATKINLLKKIINNKFSYKEINFSKEKGFIFTTLYDSSLSDSKILSPTDLSSGEQHELVLLYELLFKVEPNSLVLIDEPELSLHVGWQVQFLKDLQEITKLADLDILIATHSPDIIQDRWDLTVELKGPVK